MKILIVALGGNALIRFGEEGTTEEQFRNLKVPLSQIAELSRDFKVRVSRLPFSVYIALFVRE
ncbi:MAG: hypothetical protein ACFE85_13290 [Candidatus Hodarchaeota archaeon]